MASSTQTLSPRIYRVMSTCPVDGLPVIGSVNSIQLGARLGNDVKCDHIGHVVMDGSGMSVTPAWRMLDYSRIPRRLKDRFPGASGSNKTACYAMGVGRFVRAPVTDDLELIPDSPKHGVVAPANSMTYHQYSQALAGTRTHWQKDES
jgi:hypothetical protein